MHQEMYATSDYGIPIKNSKYRSARHLVFSRVHLLYTSYYNYTCADSRCNKLKKNKIYPVVVSASVHSLVQMYHTFLPVSLCRIFLLV